MDFSEKILKRITIEVENRHFWNMIGIHTFNPQLLNRRIVGGSIMNIFEWPLQRHNLKSMLNCVQELGDLSKLQDREKFDSLDTNEVKSSLQSDCHNLKSCIISIKLLQKNQQNPELILITFLNVPECTVSYFTYYKEKGFLKLKSGYYLHHRNSDFELGRYTVDGVEDKDEWLKHMFPKFIKWMSSESPRGRYNIPSLSLVNIEDYSLKYSQMKDKYGEDLVKDWPEVTDPQKFVFEDIAIATYLLLLWQEERKLQGISKFQSFIDVGCGNGLLVFILNSEGHLGIGIDLRKRKIWDNYPKTVQLLEKTINPTEEDQMPETDWIIGNHSDEMSPWIPVLAAQNSSNCNFFLLPCCAYEFNGMKYQRRNCKNSLYYDFIDYTIEISEICGFSVDIDRLRIPSTKRICLIGKDREPVEKEILIKFIEEKSNIKFKAREAVERVRNCTQLPKNITNEIVRIVFNELLQPNDHHDSEIKKWNPGVTLDMPDLIEKIPKDLLKVLKEECGGLQTLLRNHHQIFEVMKGQVKIRYPQKIVNQEAQPGINDKKSKSRRSKRKFKERDCWFHQNHPDGCPLSNDDCSYRHNSINE